VGLSEWIYCGFTLGGYNLFLFCTTWSPPGFSNSIYHL